MSNWDWLNGGDKYILGPGDHKWYRHQDGEWFTSDGWYLYEWQNPFDHLPHRKLKGKPLLPVARKIPNKMASRTPMKSWPAKYDRAGATQKARKDSRKKGYTREFGIATSSAALIPFKKKENSYVSFDNGADNFIRPLGENIAPFVLNLVRAGSAAYNRRGRQFVMKTLRLRSFISCLTSTAQEADQARMLLVYDRQPNGFVPTNFGTVCSDTLQDGSQTGDIFAFPNLTETRRFLILRDILLDLPEQFVVSAANPFDPVRPIHIIDEFIKLKGLEVQYKADATPEVIGSITAGSLLLYIIKTRPDAGTPAVRTWFAKTNTILQFDDE